MLSVAELGSDWTVLPVVVLGLFGLLGLGEGLRAFGIAAAHTRRFVHSGAALAGAGLPLVFSRPLPVYGLALLFVVANAAAKHVSWWGSIHEARPRSWGTVTMPIAVVVGVAGTWSVTPDRILIFQVAFLVLAVADPLAAWMGQRWGRRPLWPGTTALGSGVFFLCTGGVVGGMLLGVGEWGVARMGGVSLLVAGAATAAEGISRRGLDNLSIVLAVLLVLVPVQAGHVTVPTLLGAGAAGIAFGTGAHATHTLTREGAVGGGLFAATLVGVGGTAWVGPGITFFGLSSGLSFLPVETQEREHRSQNEQGRTLRQVLANGGVAWGLLAVSMLLPPSLSSLQMGCYLGFLGALAAAAADTWATELGTRYAGRPWSLWGFHRVAPGTSGAVSLAGTGGAVLGAVSIAGAAYVSGGFGAEAGYGMTVIGAGVAGMGVDSLLGATAQAQYFDPETDALVERPVKANDTPIQGWSGVDNEVVNLCGTAAGAVVAAGTLFVG